MQTQEFPSTTIPVLVVGSLVPTPPEVRKQRCCWCWEQSHPGVPYPEEWSSTICVDHEAMVDAQRQARLERKAHQAQSETAIIGCTVFSVGQEVSNI